MKSSRTKHLLNIRPIIPTVNLDAAISKSEHFQNQTLRPIIKFQHDLLIAIFKNYLIKKKLIHTDLSSEKMKNIIDQVFLKDSKFKIRIQGIVIGQFTLEEHEGYVEQSSEINKRISQIIKERLISNIEHL